MNFFPLVTCSDITVANGEVTYDVLRLNGSYPVNTVATFSCDSGFSLSGSISSTCQTSTAWIFGNLEPQIPTCNLGNENIITTY